MHIVLRLLWVVIIAGLGGIIYAVLANIMVMSGMITSDNVRAAFGHEMTHKAVMVWMACVPLAVWSAFMQTKWRYILLLAPLYAPSLFAVIFALMNKTGA